MVEDLAPSKRALRAEVRERRRIMTASERDATAAGLLANMKRVVDQYAAGRIACYLSINDEPPTREFLDWAVGEGLLVYLPVAREDGLMSSSGLVSPVCPSLRAAQVTGNSPAPEEANVVVPEPSMRDPAQWVRASLVTAMVFSF